MRIRDLIESAYDTAKSKGWHDQPRNVGEEIALMHSELSEALEVARGGHKLTEIYWIGDNHKPEGCPVELADCVIRIADFCGERGIDLEAAIEVKMAYNRTRPHRHGKVF